MLSPREKQVVDLLLLGKSNKQIALALGVTERTIEFHLKNIYIKMEVTSRVELILKLGKSTGDGFYPDLLQSTVDFEKTKIDNGNQPAQLRAAQAWKNLVFLIKKEVAMTFKISFEDLENYLRSKPFLFGLLVLLSISFMIRYIVFDLGLYFWVSYILLELILILGSLRFGKLLNQDTSFKPLSVILVAGTLPLIAAGFDQAYLLMVLPYTGATTISIPTIQATAEWLTSANGFPCLVTNLSITSDGAWFLAIGEVLLLFLLSRKFGKPSGGNKLAIA